MTNPYADSDFSRSIPELYQALMVPMLFEPYADDLAERAAARRPHAVLELAAGTGAVTRALARALPRATRIVATDLNDSMLQQAALHPVERPVTWQQADAQQLPFDDGAFDLVVCQFGVMFFPDKPAAFREARRVLRPGGTLLFNVWDRIEHNDFACTVSTSLVALFDSDSPHFMSRTPHGYFERDRIARDLTEGGFAEGGLTEPLFETVPLVSHALSARHAATAFCQGTPMRNEILLRDAARLGPSTDAATAALVAQFGTGEIDGRMVAHVITATR